MDVDRVHTNIVNCYIDRFADDADDINRALRERGVLAISRGSRVRFVTHAQVSEASVDAAVNAMAEIIGAFPASAANHHLSKEKS